MPVEIRGNLVRLTQRQFASVAYDVVNEAFSIHNEFGSLFDEAVYRNALISRLDDASAEVQIDVKFEGFHKSYFIDAVVAGGSDFLPQLTRLMQATRLESAQWINISRKKVTFKTLHLSVPHFSVK